MPPFARRGPSGRFPRVYARTAALRLPASPPRSLALARRFRPCCAGESWISLVPRRPSPRMPRLSDPGGTAGAEPPGPRSLRFAPPASPSELADPSASTTFFLSGSNSAACVLAVYASQPGSSLDHARLASGWRPCLAGREFNPPGRCVRFAITCWRSHGFLLTEASRRTAR